MPIDYKNGKIYKMVSPSGLVYVGSTCESLAARKAKHKRCYKYWKNGNLKQQKITSFQLFDEAPNEIDIVLLESFPCDSKEQLHARERHHIESIQCVNKHIPLRTPKEYREDNKDAIKQYRVDHRESLLQQKRDTYKLNQKELLEKQRKYYWKSRDRILQKNKKIIPCSCGSIYTTNHKVRHINTKKHQQWQLQQEQQPQEQQP